MTFYYYAGGSRIDLHKDDEFVAVDRSAAPPALVDEVTGGRAAASRSVGPVVVAAKASIEAGCMDALREAGALRPVFRCDRAMLVPLPEVRVEMDDSRQRQAVRRLLSAGGLGVVVTEESDDRLVLKPASGNPIDALKAANTIYEDARPAASSVRFVQFVARPDPKK